ncbi:MAG: SGNH/GDSL hydrolase family protein [Clostridiales bacterium]|nr:SGNH/GDSL hydrolase family protein [Clostridiales bacterium]
MPVVVSLGGSYSSGEGIEPYYGQDSVDKYDIEDWICHRSELSWPGMLEVNGTTLSSVRGTNWFFGAVSGAVTKNIYSDNDQDKQVKTVSQPVRQNSLGEYINISHTMNFQLDTITSLPDPAAVDYVTLTIGGNDVDFTGVLTEAMFPDYVNLSKGGLKQKLVNIIESFWETTDGSKPMAGKLENTYRKILEAAPNAKLIVAGYPQLIHYEAENSSSLYTDRQSESLVSDNAVFTISDTEAKLIDNAVSTFDKYIKTIVESQMDGENIVFVDVQDVFAGHEAYSDDPYIEGLVFGASENVDKSGTGSVISSASFHPNEKGAKAYAGAVQEVFTQYDEKPVLVVCDENGNPYENYTVKIEGTQYAEQSLLDGHLKINMPTSYSQEMNADSTEPLQLTLTKGDYTITVTDQSNPGNSISKDIKVRKNYDGKEIRMSGSFETFIKILVNAI